MKSALLKRVSLNWLFQLSPRSLYSLGNVLKRSTAMNVAAPQGGSIELFPVSFMEYRRFDRLLTKEPETIAWIDGFESDAVLLDVGANVGVYSVYALLRHARAQVIALEPEPLNFTRLVDNLQRTSSARSVAYPFAISTDTALGQLAHRQPGEYGTSYNQLGGSHAFKTGCFVSSIDDLINTFGVPMPTHIKIDVDGIELAIVKGMSKTMRRPELVSVLVESQDLEMTAQLLEIFREAGFVRTHPSTDQRGNQIFVKRSGTPPAGA
jgi:FkbM family methyltransferase